MRDRAWWAALPILMVAFILLGYAGDPEFDRRVAGGSFGFLWLLIGAVLGWALLYAGVLVIRKASCKAFSDVVSTTVSSTAKWEHPIPELRTEDGKVAYPEMEVYELGGGGPLNGVSISGGREYGYLLARKGVVVEVQGNYFINAYTHAYYPGLRMSWRFAARLLPDIFDERVRLPVQFIAHLRANPRFNDNSILYVAEVPIFAQLRYAMAHGMKRAANLDFPGPVKARVSELVFDQPVPLEKEERDGQTVWVAKPPTPVLIPSSVSIEIPNLASPDHVLFNFGERIAQEAALTLKDRSDFLNEQNNTLQEQNDLFRDMLVQARDIMKSFQYEDSGLKAQMEQMLGRQDTPERGG